jgi:flagellar biosynthetic protein FliQ
MQEADIAAIMRETLMVALKLGAPLLLVGLVVGLLVSLLQTITQINESTLAFVPKVLAIGATLLLLGPFMFATLGDMTRMLFDRMVAAGAR